MQSKNYIHDQLGNFVLSLFFVLFKFCFLFCAFCFSYMKTFEVTQKFCDSNTIVLSTQLTFIEKVVIVRHLYIHHYFSCYCPVAKEIPNSHIILFIQKKYLEKNVGHIYFSSKISVFSFTIINNIKISILKTSPVNAFII